MSFGFIFGRPFVKRFALCYLISDRCLSCLSVTLVYCGQTVWWIRMPLGMVGHIVLDGDPAPTLNFQTMSVVAKRLDRSRCHLVRRYRPRPRRHCVRRHRCGLSSLTKRGTAAAPSLFDHFALARSPMSATSKPLIYGRL